MARRVRVREGRREVENGIMIAGSAVLRCCVARVCAVIRRFHRMRRRLKFNVLEG